MRIDYKYFIAFLLYLTLVACMPAENKEYIVKMSYIEKFSRFIEWPGNSMNGEFIIAVIGKNPFASILDDFSRKYKIKNLPVTIKYASSIEEIGNCHILFISDSEKRNLPKIVSYIQDKPVLMISESKGFAEKGVHLNFYITSENTVHFEVNPISFTRSGLKIDLYLLEFGKRVGG